MPRRTILRLLRALLLGFVAVTASALSGGCARVPAGVNQNVGKQLIVTMTVSGQINPNDYYFVIFNNTNNTNGSVGPIPVIGPPWGNGFVSGAATQCVEYTGANPSPGYLAFSIGASPFFQLVPGLQAPVQSTPVSGGTNTLEFRIPLSELATANVPASQITSLQINFLATDTLPVNSIDSNAQHDFDALGNPFAGQLNNYITISTAQDTTYDNSTAGSIEPTGDVASCTGTSVLNPDTGADAPNLDIINWSVQITG